MILLQSMKKYLKHNVVCTYATFLVGVDWTCLPVMQY